MKSWLVKKKGMSAIITTVILVALAMVAILIVWGVVSNILASSEEDISAQANFMKLNMKVISVEKNAGDLEILVKRNPGQGKFNFINFVIGYSDGDVEVIKEISSLGELGAHRFSLDLAGDINSITSVSIAPANVDENGKSRVGNVLDTLEIKKINSVSAPTEGLVLYMPFDVVGNLSDASGNGNNGINNGAVWTSNGAIDGAMSFDGVDDYIHTTTEMLVGNFSFSIWFYISNNATSRAASINLLNSDGFAIYQHSLNDLIYFYGIGARYIDWKPEINKWHHLSCSVNFAGNTTDDYQADCYANGVLKLLNQAGYLNPSTYLRISYPTNSIDGLMDEVRIYNRALTESEIQILYSQR